MMDARGGPSHTAAGPPILPVRACVPSRVVQAFFAGYLPILYDQIFGNVLPRMIDGKNCTYEYAASDGRMPPLHHPQSRGLLCPACSLLIE